MLTNVKIDQCFSPGGKSIMVARQQEGHTCALSHSTHLCEQIHSTFWTNTFRTHFVIGQIRYMECAHVRSFSTCLMKACLQTNLHNIISCRLYRPALRCSYSKAWRYNNCMVHGMYYMPSVKTKPFQKSEPISHTWAWCKFRVGLVGLGQSSSKPLS